MRKFIRTCPICQSFQECKKLRESIFKCKKCNTTFNETIKRVRLSYEYLTGMKERVKRYVLTKKRLEELKKKYKYYTRVGKILNLSDYKIYKLHTDKNKKWLVTYINPAEV